jgi:hypothetical protein
MRRLTAFLTAVAALLIAAAPAAAQDPWAGAPQLGPGALNRYSNGSTVTHWVTTGPVTPGYAFEGTLGFLLTGGGPGRVAIFGCRSGTEDYFLSHDAGCEGRTQLSRYGFAYTSAPAGIETVPLYRCVRPGIDHFASGDPGCEGQVSEGLLGHIRARSDVLMRFTGATTHRVTTQPVTSDWAAEGPMGLMLPTGGENRRPIYGCLAGSADYFLSLDSGCEGQRSLGLEGHAYATPPTSEQTVAVYRCLRPGIDHFTSHDSRCEGQRTEALLGYLRYTGDGLHRYYNAGTGTHWVTPGMVSVGFRYESTLGFVQPTGGPNLRAIHGCRSGAADYFVSSDPNCEGRSRLGRYGFVYVSPPAGLETVAIYRCRSVSGHFVSTDPACERTAQEGRLGYVRSAEVGPAPAPACAASTSTVEAGLRGRPRKTVRFGQAITLSGRALRPGGAPAAGVGVAILVGGTALAEVGRVTTGPDGGFAFRVPPGTSRTLRAGFRAAAGDVALACSAPLSLSVRAKATLRVRPRRTRNGRRVRFRGRVLGEGLPPRGKLVDLQAFDARRWRTFKTTRSRPDGRFRASYRFVRTTRRARTFRFRARVRREAPFPYTLGGSRTVRVHVRP